MKASKLIVTCPRQVDRGRALAAQFSMPLIVGLDLLDAKSRELERFMRAQLEPNDTEPQYLLLLTRNGLSLAQLRQSEFLCIRADFYGPSVRYRREKGGGRGQMIAKAIGLAGQHSLSVLDATAGLGRDAFVLASLGCHMTMLERVPEVRALIADGLAQAAEWGALNDPELISILKRMQLIGSDAITHMRALNSETAPDAIYLDPMFPTRSKHAAVKKEMRVFHDLIGTDSDAAVLLSSALECAKKRVVVKRPRLAPTLDSTIPSYSLEGKSNRFDVYVRS